jgi:hypothetical protein
VCVIDCQSCVLQFRRILDSSTRIAACLEPPSPPIPTIDVASTSDDSATSQKIDVTAGIVRKIPAAARV